MYLNALDNQLTCWLQYTRVGSKLGKKITISQMVIENENHEGCT